MARIKASDITINGWTEEGVAWTHARKPAGFRNRRDRRAGVRYEHEHGPHDLIDDESYALAADAAHAEQLVEGRWMSVWAFKAGHVYALDVEIDDDPTTLYIDARAENRVDETDEGIVVLEWRALTADELDELGIAPLGGSTDDDDAASEVPEADPSGTGAPADDDADDQEPEVEGGAGEDEVHGSPSSADDPAEDQATGEAGEAEGDDAQGDAHALSVEAGDDSVAGDEDGEEPSTGDQDFDGKVDDFKELAEALSDDELAHYAEVDSRKGVREHAAHLLEQRKLAGDDEDAVSGDGDPASDEEE